MNNYTHLIDWLTNDTLKFNSKKTSSGDRILHDHDFYEIFYIIKGSIKHTLNGETKTLKQGDLLFINLKDRHIFLRDENTICEHRDIIIRQDLFKEICDNISSDFFSLMTNDKIDHMVNISNSKILSYESRLQELTNSSLINTSDALISRNFILYEILSLFFNKTLTDNTSKYPQWFSEMLSRFDNPTLIKKGIPAIIEPFFFSFEHICRSFKKYINMTMTDYLNQKRMQEAANMLVYTNA
ncbi:MAG: AraC family ligand binding domain-containing protein, partial [Bacilli bacterium]|nr:AraC family ligand binding domain-containing protein [Bacilli bacterium]